MYSSQGHNYSVMEGERGGGVVFVREVVLLVLIKETVSVIWSDILAMFLS